jgi:hypothetical protein
MTMTKSKLTLLLKIFSVTVLAYSMCGCFSMVSTLFEADRIPFRMVASAGNLFAVVINVMLVVIIYKNKDSSSLFLPCLLIGIEVFLSMTAHIVITFIDHSILNILQTAPLSIIIAAVFLFIAIDSKKGSKLALPSLLTLIALRIAGMLIGIASSIISFHFFSFSAPDMLSSMILNQSLFTFINVIFTSSTVIILFLWRTVSLRKIALRTPTAENTSTENIGQP